MNTSEFSPFHWQGKPSIFLTASEEKARQQHTAPKRLELDAQAMLAMRQKGFDWRSIAERFGCSVQTAISRVREIEPAGQCRTRGRREPGVQ